MHGEEHEDGRPSVVVQCFFLAPFQGHLEHFVGAASLSKTSLSFFGAALTALKARYQVDR